MSPVLVDIENLALKGFCYEDRYAIVVALQDELMRLLAAPETAARLAKLGQGAHSSVDAIDLEAIPAPRRAGAATARAIGKGLMK